MLCHAIPQVTRTVTESFVRESRRRKLWLLLAILVETMILWAMFSFANSRARLQYQTTYFDPFSPTLYSDDATSYLRISSFASSFSQSIMTSSFETKSRKAWSPFYLVCKQLAIKVASFGLGPKNFVHGTHGETLVSPLLAATTTIIYRVPT